MVYTFLGYKYIIIVPRQDYQNITIFDFQSISRDYQGMPSSFFAVSSHWAEVCPFGSILTLAEYPPTHRPFVFLIYSA